jgi:hypothetical protein
MSASYTNLKHYKFCLKEIKMIYITFLKYIAITEYYKNCAAQYRLRNFFISFILLKIPRMIL